MSDLKKAGERARRHQTFQTAEEKPAPPSPNPARPEPEEKPAPPSPKAVKKQAARSEDAPTGNQIAREASGVQAPPAPTRAERQASRRRHLAVLTVELEPGQKAELLSSAAANGRTLRAEVLHRLGFS